MKYTKRTATTLIFIIISGQIGERTRSKLPLKSVPLEELEQQLIAPDVTPDMFYYPPPQPGEDDWQEFLQGLFKTLRE